MRVIAVDWSGAKLHAEKTIWLCEAREAGVVRLECGRGRDVVAAHLVDEAGRDRRMAVGLDFAFSLPRWFLAERGFASAPDLWRAMDASACDAWLDACEPPFWGRPGRPRPAGIEMYRRTDREVAAIGGIRPKSPFQVGGAGAVGTGSLRGMAVLHRLRCAGFSIWPFDAPGMPVAAEIYPRIFTGPVHKANPDARARYLRCRFADIDARMRRLAESSEDAFDALVSALAMAQHMGELEALPLVDDPQLRLEGLIWQPAAAA